MIVRNLNDPEVLATSYVAHGGGVGRMLLTGRELEGIEFLAFGTLESGKTLEEHIDPVEEIYFILSGEGLMKVGEERRQVRSGDAIWIPAGEPHSLHNNSSQTCTLFVVAAYPFHRLMRESK